MLVTHPGVKVQYRMVDLRAGRFVKFSIWFNTRTGLAGAIHNRIVSEVRLYGSVGLFKGDEMWRKIGCAEQIKRMHRGRHLRRSEDSGPLVDKKFMRMWPIV